MCSPAGSEHPAHQLPLTAHRGPWRLSHGHPGTSAWSRCLGFMFPQSRRARGGPLSFSPSPGRQRSLPECVQAAGHQARERGCCLGGAGNLGSGPGRRWHPSSALEPECPSVCNEMKSNLLKSIHDARIPGKRGAVDMLQGRNSCSFVGHDPLPRKAWAWLSVRGLPPTHSHPPPQPPVLHRR